MVLDARPEGIIYRDLIPEYVNFARTIYEGLSFCSSFLYHDGFENLDVLTIFVDYVWYGRNK